MKATKVLIILIVLFSSALITPAQAALSNEQMYSLFNQANHAFRQANAATDDLKSQKLYDKAILSFEKLITDGQIQNARLYYNLANAYFLKGELGRAILNYRRAENLDNADTDIQKNLAFARSRRIDKVKVKTQKRILQTLFFWHYDFSIKTKFTVACLCFAIVCISLTAMLWLGRSPPATVAATIAAILTVCFFASVVLEANDRTSRICGVITTGEVVARQGDGQNYSPSFKDPLNAGTEFDLLEHRPGWFHIELSDNSTGWIPETTADLI